MSHLRQSPMYKIRFRKGDTVVIRSGKYKGQTGKILRTHPRENKVTVEGINIVKKHLKPNRLRTQGDIVEVTKPMWASKVSLLDPGTKRPARIAYKLDADKKARVYAKSRKEID